MKVIKVEWPYVEDKLDAYEEAYQEFINENNEKEKDYADKASYGE